MAELFKGLRLNIFHFFPPRPNRMRWGNGLLECSIVPAIAETEFNMAARTKLSLQS